jgi:hypothetical protein
MRKLLVFFGLLIGLFSCQKSEYSGYALSRTGMDYKLLVLGDEKQVLQDSDMVELAIKVFSGVDSSLFSGEISKMYLASQDTGMQELLGLLAVGDSASAYMSSSKINDFLPLIPVQKIRVEIGVKSKLNYTSWMFYKKYPELSKDLEIKEQLGLLSYLMPFATDSVEVVNGMFLIRKVVSNGLVISSKDVVTVHYVTKTIDGKILDSTYERNEPFDFTVGQQGQVLPGFEYGIRKMRKGEIATFVIPSALAFGSKGSSTGIAKSYETLVYDVEIIDLLREAN